MASLTAWSERQPTTEQPPPGAGGSIQPPRRRTPRRLAAVAYAAVILLTACGGDDTKPATPAESADPVAASPTGSAAPAAATPLSSVRPGEVMSGTYATTVFQPEITVALDGWQMELPELERGVFLGHSEQAAFVSLMRPTVVFDLAEDGSHGPAQDAPTDARALADHLQQLPLVQATPVESVDVPGLSGYRFTLDASDLSGMTGTVGPRSLLLLGLPPDPLEREPVLFVLDEGSRAEVFVTDTTAGPLVLAMDAPADTFDAVAAAFAGVLSSVRL